MADNIDPDDAFENGMWNSDAEPYDVGDMPANYMDEPAHFADETASRSGGPAHFADETAGRSSGPAHFADETAGRSGGPAHFADETARYANVSSHFADQSPYDDGGRRPSEPTPRRPLWPWILVGALAVILVAGGITGFMLASSAQSIKTKAQTAMDFANSYLKAAKAGDSQTLQQSASGMSRTAHEVQSDLNSPLWSFASLMPVVGSDVKSVRVLSDVLVDVSDNALVPLSSNADVMRLSGLLVDGAVNVNSLQGLATAMEQAYPVIERSADTIEALPDAHIPQVASVLSNVKDKVSSANSLIGHFGPLVPQLPTLLGAGGQTKKYLVLAQNNAETHATGGFVGAIGTLTVTDGRIEMGDFGSVWQYMNESKIGAETNSVSAGATQEEITLIGPEVDTHHGDHNMVPDFSRTGQMYATIDQIINEEHVDGVLSFDPVFLQYMLGVVGGVETSFDIMVDGTNAAPFMLNESLFWWQPSVCDQFYDEVAKKAFVKILSNLGSADTSEFFSMLVKSADEGRCIAWAADPAAEEAIKKSGFGWELSHDETQPMTGVYINNRVSTKAAYYLSLDPKIDTVVNNPDGSKTYDITLTMRHNMDPSIVGDDLPEYIKMLDETMHNRSIVDLHEDLYLIAPEGGTIEDLTFERLNNSGAPTPEIEWKEATLQGLQVFQSRVRIDAGESVVFHYKVTTSPKAEEALKVRKTPVIPPEIGGWPE